ncbi:hypothetical protein DXN04_05915 [Chitinophaga silvisoli]|uniref:Lipoprotein n=1 Tax=Chitinophaga silvisoli TaxID=2291814 RepID=A0A3E1NST9_9BACT|nr:hypothetical protein DXN04_31730 [Chitinophaga silvisoli]RFM37033.1 hypothetical protein DXN04_05915 [Chitinophaga silvisoli]
MKNLLLLLICFTFLLLLSCSSSRHFEDRFISKGCNIDSVRKQSEIAFKKLDKKRKTPAGLYKTQVYENDTSIFVLRLLSDGNIRNGGGMIFEISKRTCTIVDSQLFQ